MDHSESRKQRRERHAAEIEESQQALRYNIAEAGRLLGESEKILKRHRDERKAADD